MHAVGVDIIEIERVGRVVQRYGDRFLRRIYTPGELAYCRGRLPQLAARFAAKEAMMKALGTGRRGVSWRDIEVVRARGRAPAIQLAGRALAVAQRQGVQDVALSISHSRDYAVASVVVERNALSPPVSPSPSGEGEGDEHQFGGHPQSPARGGTTPSGLPPGTGRARL